MNDFSDLRLQRPETPVTPEGQHGPRLPLVVTASAGCARTASSNATWITVTAGTPGSGGGSVQFSVDVNATGAPRSGTITIAGQAFTISQES